MSRAGGQPLEPDGHLAERVSGFPVRGDACDGVSRFGPKVYLGAMTPMGRFARPLLVVLGAAVAGCGSGGGGDGGVSGDGGVQLTPADKAFISDFCAAVMPCCATNGMNASAAGCQQAIAKAGWSRDPQLRSACLDELRQLAAGPACVPDVADLADPCVRVFDEPSGPRAPGETCASAADCAGSPGTVTLCFGTCVSYTAGADGDYPCLGNEFPSGIINAIPMKNGSNTPESHGFLCQQRAGLTCDTSDNRCKSMGPNGSACTGPAPCDPNVCGATVCIPLAGPGAACTADCSGDNYCDTGAGFCKPRLAAGAACSDSNQCSGDCHGADRCSGFCGGTGTCSSLTIAQTFVLGSWCAATGVSP